NGERLSRLALVRGGGTQCRGSQVALQSIGEPVDLLLLTLAKLQTREHRTTREGERRKTTGAFQHRPQCFTALDGEIAGEADFADERDLFLLAPFRYFLHVQEVEWLQHQIGAGIATHD